MPAPMVKEVDYSNVELMLKYADEYQIADLRRRSVNVLIALEKKWTGSDNRLLEILRIATTYREKELLPTVIKKCASGFEMYQLRPMFHSLPLEVIAGLLMYKSEQSSDQKCQFRSMTGGGYCSCGNSYYNKCEHCQKVTCYQCQNNEICSKRMEIVDQDILAFLDRMYTA